MVYAASQIKPRASRQAMIERMGSLYAIVEEIKPCTVRQVFYQATVRGLIDKTETGYDKVQRALADMRRQGVLPYSWIADNTRWQRKPRSYANTAEALEEVAQFYRKDLWREADDYVEMWLEKDALSGVIYPVTETYDVPLMVARGYASLSFLHGSAETIKANGRITTIYHLGDFDPSGVNAGEKIEETLRALAPEVPIVFQRLAVNPEQIAAWSLPSRPTKTSDSRAKRFGYAESVELDAIHPDLLRALVEQAIRKHLPERQLQVLREAEASERQWLMAWANVIRDQTDQETNP